MKVQNLITVSLICSDKEKVVGKIIEFITSEGRSKMHEKFPSTFGKFILNLSEDKDFSDITIYYHPQENIKFTEEHENFIKNLYKEKSKKLNFSI